ncbi:hypothetical protein BH24ACT11_BH24ACT11_07110 [soil metagenome]
MKRIKAGTLSGRVDPRDELQGCENISVVDGA